MTSSCLKVAFCAAPSSRKSTICSGLESKLKQAQVNADTSREYARQFIMRYNVPRDLSDQIFINQNQDDRDIAISNVSEVMLTDTPPMACYVYSIPMLNAIMAERKQEDYSPSQYKYLEEMYIRALKKTRWFDMIFVLEKPSLVVDDGTRVQNVLDAAKIHDALIGFLHTNCIDYIQVPNVNTEKRIDFCFDAVMARLQKQEHFPVEVSMTIKA